MGVYARQAGHEKAEELLKRALKIREAKLGAGDPRVAVTLHELARCVRKAGRLGESEALFRRALEIRETKLGANNRTWAI